MGSRLSTVVVVLVAACDMRSVDIDGRVFACQRTSDCGPGFECRAERCVREGEAGGGSAGGNVTAGGNAAGGNVAGGSVDAGREPDVDAGFDAGSPTDAGSVDDAGVDSGVPVDAGHDGGQDAGHDAGSASDSGLPDAGVADAGAMVCNELGWCWAAPRPFGGVSSRLVMFGPSHGVLVSTERGWFFTSDGGFTRVDGGLTSNVYGVENELWWRRPTVMERVTPTSSTIIPMTGSIALAPTGRAWFSGTTTTGPFLGGTFQASTMPVSCPAPGSLAPYNSDVALAWCVVRGELALIGPGRAPVSVDAGPFVGSMTVFTTREGALVLPGGSADAVMVFDDGGTEVVLNVGIVSGTPFVSSDGRVFAPIDGGVVEWTDAGWSSVRSGVGTPLDVFGDSMVSVLDSELLFSTSRSTSKMTRNPLVAPRHPLSNGRRMLVSASGANELFEAVDGRFRSLGRFQAGRELHLSPRGDVWSFEDSPRRVVRQTLSNGTIETYSVRGAPTNITDVVVTAQDDAWLLADDAGMTASLYFKSVLSTQFESVPGAVPASTTWSGGTVLGSDLWAVANGRVVIVSPAGLATPGPDPGVPVLQLCVASANEVYLRTTTRVYESLPDAGFAMSPGIPGLVSIACAPGHALAISSANIYRRTGVGTWAPETALFKAQRGVVLDDGSAWMMSLSLDDIGYHR